MASGVTGGLDLTVETLEFIYSNWTTRAQQFPQAVTFDHDLAAGQYDTFQYDSSQYTSVEAWETPVLRNGDDKTIYPGGGTTNYNASLRNNDVVTVTDGGRIDEPTGTEFDFDVVWELDLTIESLLPGQSVIDHDTEFNILVNIVKRAIMVNRSRPITDPECKFDWRWIEMANESPLPESVGNRDLFGKEITVRWMGYENLPSL